jgi:hypothetical protein
MVKKNNVKKRGGNPPTNSGTTNLNPPTNSDKPVLTQNVPEKKGFIGTLISILYTIFVVIIGGIVIANILAVLMMCGIIYMMMHFVLLMVNGIIKLIRSIFPFLKKKLKPIKVWPHELILDALGIKFDSNDPSSALAPTTDKNDYCPSK